MDNSTNDNKLIQLDDIAKALEISKSTVSRAISGKGRVSDTTRKKVQEYIASHNYRPNLIAKGFATSRTYNICVVLPTEINYAAMPFYQVCLMGVSEYAAIKDYDVIVTTTSETDISNLRRIIQNRKVDGVVLVRKVQLDESVNFLKQSSIPFIIIGDVGEDLYHVFTDYKTACCELTSYLVSSCKPQCVGLIMGDEAIIMNKRKLEGYNLAFEKAGIKPDKTKMFMNTNNRLAIEQALSEMLKTPTECIVCGDDIIAAQTLVFMRDHGRIIGHDIKIASLNNNAYLHYNNPPITTVQINVKKFGEIAAKNLINLINGEDVPKSTYLDYEVLIKRSTM